MPVIGRTPYRNLILTGSTGTGKTGVGRRMTSQMEDASFIDLEIEIQERHKYTPAQIRSIFGQARLTAIESEMVQELSLRRSNIIAINSTVLLEPKNLEQLRETGPILCLTASLGEILRRLHVQLGGQFQDPEQRALIVGRLKRERSLLTLDLPQYDTTDKGINVVATQVKDFWLANSDL